ncbi:unnamed protein product [Cuscuta europaea]|uniref:Uncharacterized protein n=1 Tax=Cuscuta europaea TaxID=41803 RepID=A0A9P1EEM1_CUSEU|nr:unnamed protein product [Cuscuta europaea]
MDRRSIMALAKAKAKEKMAAKLAAASGVQPSSDAPKKPPTQLKTKMSGAPMQSKKTKRASPLADADAGGLTMPADDVGGSNAVAVVDAVSVPSSTTMSQPPLLAKSPGERGSARS